MWNPVPVAALCLAACAKAGGHGATASDTASATETGDPFAGNSHGPAPLDCPESSVYGGSITFTGETAAADAHAFCEAYNAVSVGITIWETDWQDLSPLSCLCEAPWLSISGNEALGSLAGLDHFNGDESSVSISENPLLTNLEGLVDVPHLREFTIHDSPGITSIDGFPSAMPTESVALRSLSNLQDFSAMPEWTVVPGTLELSGLPYLVDLSPLENVTAVGNLLIADLPVASFQGLTALVRVDTIAVEQSVDFDSLSGLSSTLEMRELRLRALPGLEQLTGLSADFALPSLVVWDTALSSLDGLQSLTALETLALYENSSLTSLSGLPSLTRLGDWILVDNRELADISALGQVADIDSLGIYGSGEIASIEAFQNLRSIGALEMNDMPLLTDLSPLYGVVELEWSIWLTDNVGITEEECHALKDALTANGVEAYNNVYCGWF